MEPGSAFLNHSLKMLMWLFRGTLFELQYKSKRVKYIDFAEILEKGQRLLSWVARGKKKKKGLKCQVIVIATRRG